MAVALGVGVAIVTGCAAIASADAGSPESSATSVSSSPSRNPVHTGPAQRTKRPTIPTRQPSAAATAAPARQVRAVSTRTAPRAVAQMTPTVNPNALPPTPALKEIWVGVASSVMGLAESALRAVGIATYLGPTTSTLNQTLVVNGYNLVPSSTETVTSFYGQWTFWPGGPTLVQGQQQYSVVDPATNQPVGTFDALVSTGSPFNIRSKYVELLVTANDGINVGTGPGQVPPVGSLIASFNLIAGFGWSYTAMPSSPNSVVSFRLTTPFGDIPLPFGFDASKGIADHSVLSQPVYLGNGYSIAPADPAGQIYVGTSGFLPYYTTVQSHGVFNLRDSAGDTVGSFEGVTTPTADVMGVHTQAILVTKVIDGTTGTNSGDVPGVGSVFNVMYENSDTTYVVYSSLTDPYGDVVSNIKVDGATVTNINTFPLNILDASAPPPVKRLPIAGGYSVLPTTALTPTGVNGLPPREIQIQGYQQFGVYDSAGVQRGTFEADVATQRDLYGNYSQAILVTKVIDGTAGTTPGEVPPVGSTFNYLYFGNSGFGTYNSAMPSPTGAKTSFKFLTPLIDIPTWSMYDASAGLTNVVFADRP
ncbi:hypothetical protein [Mycolicibacterium sp.]|uniref:hypothetical protein n=1 Tax=Mycolicibacterium sp. TaxID=2320850 RepID=UPI0025D731CD|nr:hypothetical protein [Mycolicibacterium sp.]